VKAEQVSNCNGDSCVQSGFDQNCMSLPHNNDIKNGNNHVALVAPQVRSRLPTKEPSSLRRTMPSIWTRFVSDARSVQHCWQLTLCY
jgi:hypothetical protein